MKRRIKPEDAVPFLSHIGVRTVRFDRVSAVVELERRDDLVNHVGSLHAAVVFSAAECASGALLTHNFDVAMYIPLLKTVTVTYQAQVFKKATAIARINAKHLDQALEDLHNLGKSDLAIDVEVENEEGILAAKVTTLWALRSMTPSRV
jgi:acyl-coenzyme A thioesterase PaaI-like protein